MDRRKIMILSLMVAMLAGGIATLENMVNSDMLGIALGLTLVSFCVWVLWEI